METIAAFVVSAIVAIVCGWLGIPVLRSLRAKQTVSTSAPSTHAAKQGTPTLGGLFIVGGATVPVVLYCALHAQSYTMLAVLATTVMFGAIGFLDDALIVLRGKNLGLKARQKLALQFIAAIAFVGFVRMHQHAGITTRLQVGRGYDLGLAYYPIAVVMIVGLTNAVNLADGLDGLAAGIVMFAAGALAVTFHGATALLWAPVFCASLSGACAGFLWFNSHPAQVFMGDTGALALGGGLGCVAIAGKMEAPMQLACLVPWMAVMSVLLQVAVFKYRTNRFGLEFAKAHRLFRRTPIHHHFEELGWPETRIVARFVVVTAIAAALAGAI